MTISVHKPEWLTISKEPRRYNRSAVHNQTVNEVMSYEYLGAKYYQQQKPETEARRQVTKTIMISVFEKLSEGIGTYQLKKNNDR